MGVQNRANVDLFKENIKTKVVTFLYSSSTYLSDYSSTYADTQEVC